MKITTLAEFHRAGGIASAKKRLGGKTKEEISEYMRWVRRGRSPGRKRIKKIQQNRYPEGI